MSDKPTYIDRFDYGNGKIRYVEGPGALICGADRYVPNTDVSLAHIAGLREAAQILSGYLKAGNTAGLQTGLLQDSLDDILARIAELEKP